MQVHCSVGQQFSVVEIDVVEDAAAAFVVVDGKQCWIVLLLLLLLYSMDSSHFEHLKRHFAADDGTVAAAVRGTD